MSKVVLIAVAGTAVVALSAVISVQAQALAQAQTQTQTHEAGAPRPERRDRHDAAAPAWPGAMMFNGSPEHINRVVDHLLDGLAASDLQRNQIKQIALAAAAESKLQRDSQAGLRDKALQVFAAPGIDAAGAESLRQQMLLQHDQSSKRTLLAMLDVARVLTPEQRARVTAQMKQRQSAMQERRERMEREPGERPKP